jgi:hypothetical protein
VFRYFRVPHDLLFGRLICQYETQQNFSHRFVYPRSTITVILEGNKGEKLSKHFKSVCHIKVSGQVSPADRSGRQRLQDRLE